MTDPGLPTLAVLNGPLMAQAWFHDEPMTWKLHKPLQALRHEADFHIKAVGSI
jgi:hypothetical protein